MFMAKFIKEVLMTNKTWGGRFKKSLDPRVAKFNASISFDHILYHYDILGSKAHAIMLARQGLISKNEADTIVNALVEIEKEIDSGLHIFDETYEDIHMFVEQVLIDKVGNIGKKLHTGRSRNDQVALDLRLYARDASRKIEALLNDLCDVFANLSKTHINKIMPGYTHLQQAQPITLGKYFEAYLRMFQRDISRIQDWLKRMNFSPLGAGALAGSKLPLDRAFIAEELGFYGIIENTIDAVSDRDYIIELENIISIIMMHLSRICEDLIIWATQEFNFITLDDAFSTGSSLMPNKKNPDVLELIRGKTGRVFGNLIGFLTTMKGLPLSYNKDMQEDKECLFDSVDTAINCLSIMPPFMSSIIFNTDKMFQIVKEGYLDATEILEDLVLKGIPFREAHHKVGQYVAEAMEKGCSIKDLLAKDQTTS
jgi:argininosuccinate lyase